MKKTIVILISIFATVSAGIALGYHLDLEGKTNKSLASSQLISQTNWPGGIYSPELLDLDTEPGSVKLAITAVPKIDLIGIYNGDHAKVSTNLEGQSTRPIDGNDASYFGAAFDCQEFWWQIDLGSTMTIGKFRYANSFNSSSFYIQTSSNGVDYTNQVDMVLHGGWTDSSIVPVAARYIRLLRPTNGSSGCGEAGDAIGEIEAYLAGNSATHTSSPTQIDGSEGSTKNFIQWETFTPQFALESNTTVKFRFRTSPDHATWTAWSTYQTPASDSHLDISSIADAAGGLNKYLQVESTLENTDGSHTPSVDSYSVSYHTDIKPNKPTAASAVVQ